MNAIILAGGRSSRMGLDKAFIDMEGAPLIKRQLKILKSFFKKIIIVTNRFQKYRFKTVQIVQDIIPNSGPLGGIYSGLAESSSFYNFVIACDMPFINLGLIKYMNKKASGFDAVVPRFNNKYEPLFCIYSKNCLKYIKELLDRKIFKISKVFPKVKLKEIREEEILKFGHPRRLFRNINTPQDLKRLVYG